MDIDRLHIFLDAAQTLNFSETAKRMHVSQSTVSKHMRDFEQELDVILFDRGGARLRLSKTGEALIPWARKLVRECERFQKIAHSLQEEVAGPLRIGCSTAAGKYVLPMLAARFRQRFPNVNVTMLCCRPPDVHDLLQGEKADLAVVSFEIDNPNLECQFFFSDPITLIAPADHPWAKLPEIQPEDLIQEAMILRETTSGTRRAVLSALATHDIALEDLKIALELGNAEAIVAAVAAGIGVSCISWVSAMFAIKAGDVSEVRVAGFNLQRKICMVRGTSWPPSRPAELFWGFIHEPENADLFERLSF
jgi:DNA-binding transcriptional LysR family regulator